MPPISAVRKNKEEPAQTALPFSDFPAWREAVERLPPIRQSYYRLLLLTGMRGAEAQGLRWSDVDLRTRTITLRGTKTGKDVSIPMTSAIASALKLARPMRDGVIFVGARKWNDDLPAKGHALRHSFIGVAHDLGVNEIHVRLLVGHSLSGVHASYLTRMVMERRTGLESLATADQQKDCRVARAGKCSREGARYGNVSGALVLTFVHCAFLLHSGGHPHYVSLVGGLSLVSSQILYR